MSNFYSKKATIRLRGRASRAQAALCAAATALKTNLWLIFVLF